MQKREVNDKIAAIVWVLQPAMPTGTFFESELSGFEAAKSLNHTSTAFLFRAVTGQKFSLG